MRQVWKWPVQVADYFELEMPIGTKVLTFDAQGGALPCIWGSVPVDDGAGAATERVGFRFAGTGHNIHDDECLDYIGTCQTSGGSLIWHLFRCPLRD